MPPAPANDDARQISIDAFAHNPPATVAIAVHKLLAEMQGIAREHEIDTQGGVVFFHGLAWAVAHLIAGVAMPEDREAMVAEIGASLQEMVAQLVTEEAKRERLTLDTAQLH